MYNRKISADSFIGPHLRSVSLPSRDDGAFNAKFFLKYGDEISRLWDSFLEEEAMERLIATHPQLNIPLEDTPLPNRVKNCLALAGIRTVAGIALYSPEELRSFRNMGESSIKAIADYMSSLGYPSPAGNRE